MAYEAWTVEWDMPIIVQDLFRRNSNSSWGDAPGGLAYTTVGGAETDYSVDEAIGRMLLGSVNVTRVARLPVNAAEVELTAKIFNVNAVVPAGAGFEYHARLRYIDDNNFVDLRLFPSTANTITCAIRQVVGGVETLTGFPAVSGAAATSNLNIKVQVYGSTLRARIWLVDADEPSTWNLEMTTTWAAAGAVELRAIRSGGNTNTETIVIGWDDLLVTTLERWVNITSYVDTARGGAESGGSPFTISGGDTPEASADTGGVGLPLLNADQRFTPGNTLSPYAPNIAPGSRIRVRETILDQRFDRFTGYVQYPEIQAWTESSSTSPRDQQITIPVVDRAAWIAQGRTFVSTLAEHIIYHSGPSLVAYWPMGESEGPDATPAVGAPWTLSETAAHNSFVSVLGAGQAGISWSASGIALADDLGSVSFTPSDTGVDYVNSIMLTGTRPTPKTLNAGEVLTVVCWAKPDQLVSGAVVFTLLEVATGDPVFGPYTYAGFNIDAAGRYHAAVNNSNWSGTVDGPPAVTDHGVPVALRVGFSPAVLELWVRGEVYTGTLTVTSASPWSFDDLNVGERYPGAANHAQVYLGSASDWTHDDFVAQYEMGLFGLERQSTGERIRTILAYAGVDPSELGRIDDGASLMQVARLAGRNPMDLVAEAVGTEQGEFYMAGDNRPVFADRVRLYNI